MSGSSVLAPEDEAYLSALIDAAALGEYVH